jgi:hypothetical protein
VKKNNMETKPRKIDWNLTRTMVEPMMYELIENADFEIKPIAIYCVNQKCGWYHHRKKYITVPSWIINRPMGNGFLKYYVAHELAHAVTYAQYPEYGTLCTGHGPLFMENFKKICPKEFQHFELGYKPRNAKAAGITIDKSVRT